MKTEMLETELKKLNANMERLNETMLQLLAERSVFEEEKQAKETPDVSENVNLGTSEANEDVNLGTSEADEDAPANPLEIPTEDELQTMAKQATKDGISRSAIKKLLTNEGVQSISEMDEAQAVSFKRGLEELIND